MSWLNFFARRPDGRAAELQPMPVDSPPTIGRGAIIAGAIAAALAGVYINEGGYANHPNDRGGATNFGITEATARRWGYRGDMRDFPKHCDAERTICADRIYRVDYIERPGFLPLAAIEPAVLKEAADSSVLHGQSRAAGWFIGAVNITCNTRLPVATRVSPVAIKAYTDCQQSLGKVRVCVRVLDAMDAGQRRFFDRIVANNPSQKVFYSGWTKRRLGNVSRSECGKGVAP